MDHPTQVMILRELLRQVDEGVNIDVGRQVRMPTDAYVCEDIAAREREQFFRNHPQLIGLSGDLPEPGSYFTMDDFGVPVLATRDADGGFHALLNACRHRSVQVASERRGTKSVFTCPFHAWSYRNTGDLINVADEDHFGHIDRACNGLVELPSVERDGLLWVHPNPTGELDVDALLGPDLAAELATYGAGSQRLLGEKTIAKRLNWKFANDTFGETYHFRKLHKDTLGRLFLGNNLHLTEYGRHHRFVTANFSIHDLKDIPEADWNIHDKTFVMYHLFPNVQFIVSPYSSTLIRIYPDAADASRSVTKINFYYSEQAVAAMEAAEADGELLGDVYDPDQRQARTGSVEASMEVFYSTVELEDYAMGEMQQRAAETGLLKEIVFGRNEPALHHFHTSYREALGQTPLQVIDA